ncbi:MAG: hypothetical protein FWE88_03395 [Phycisphaerae bacterium]|nr:hypothetical protein [Phycisphaerae bacterium]
MKMFPSMRGPGGVEPYDHHRGKLPLLRPTSRGRVSIFLTINFIGFVFASCFWLFITRGQWVDFDLASYWASIVTPLGVSFLRPMSVLDQHWMIFVFGLTLSALLLVPIMTAVMYRLMYAIAQAGIVFVLGHSPGLAISLAVGSFLAARTPLRSDMPFLAFLLGLVPSAVYLAVMTFIGIEPAALPFERLLVKAPVLLAFVAAVAAAGVVLTLARLAGYRPGMLWPVAAVLWIVPLALFYAHEGPARVRFNLLAQSPAMSLFGAQTSLESWRAARDDAEALDSPEAIDEAFRESGRREMLRLWRRFLDSHGGSASAPAAAYLYAQAAGLQLDRDAYDMGVVRFRVGRAVEASRPMWERLATQYKEAPQSALARLRLAELDMADGAMEQGLANLAEAYRKLQAALPAHGKERRRPAAVVELQWPEREAYQTALARVEWLLWLTRRDGVTNDVETAAVLAAWMSLDEVAMGTSRYVAELERLIEQDPGGALSDDLRLALALRGPASSRAEALLALADRRGSETWVAATYELGLLSLTVRAAAALPTTRPAAETADAPVSDRPALEEPAVYFRRVRDVGDTPWRARAVYWLTGLETGEE